MACATSSFPSTGSDDARLPPASTVSVHSVVERRVTQRTPARYASFWRPPESVTIGRRDEGLVGRVAEGIAPGSGGPTLVAIALSQLGNVGSVVWILSICSAVS